MLVLWAAVVAHTAGHRWSEGLTLGRALANAFAQSKGQRLGILDEASADDGSHGSFHATTRLMGCNLSVVQVTGGGVVAMSEGRRVDPLTVLAQMRRGFCDALGRTLQVCLSGCP